MQFSVALNTILGSILIVVLIFADYIRKYTTDRLQKIIFCSILVFSFIPMAIDFTAILIGGTSGKGVYYGLLAARVFYNIFVMLTFHFFALFIYLIIYKSRKKINLFFIGIFILNIIHLIMMLLNLKWQFLFYVDPVTNVMYLGDKYYICLVIGYSPVALSLYGMLTSRRIFGKSTLVALFVMVCFTIAVSTANILWGAHKLLWPCLSAALLCSYFFVIQSDARLDSLTGIGNRYSFNEFIKRLSKRNSGESWAIVMIDMDHFKQINDTLGHQEGDNALRDMAAIIKGCVKGSDFAARYGGDEFVLATRVDKTENGISSLMRNIQEEAEKQNKSGLRPFKLEISYGYDVFTASGNKSIEEFLTHIDSLMYKYKERQRRVGDRKGEKS